MTAAGAISYKARACCARTSGWRGYVGTIDVPKHTVDVFVAAANVVNMSGDQGGWPIQICRTPAASAAVIIVAAAAAFVPSTTSPTRSRVGR
jgi:hypothetical protein